MADETLDNQICEKCSAAVRPNALFCFNCGAQVAPDDVVIAETAAAKKVSDAWFRDDIVVTPEGADPIAERAPKQAVRAKKERQAEVSAANSKTTDDTVGIAGSRDNPPAKPEAKPALKTAASLRQQSKLTQQRKAVEVVWEQPEGPPNLWFVVVTVILLAFALGMLFLMLYLR